MARPRYPSDDIRLTTRPHVKIGLDIANHPRTAAVWANLRKRGMLVELLRIATASWAGRRGGVVVLTTPNLASIMGQQHSSNRSSVSALCSELGWTVEWIDFGLLVTIDNFSENQGFNSATRGEPPRTPSASDSDSESSLLQKTSEEKSKRPRSRAATKTPAPDALAAEELADVKRWCLASLPEQANRVPELVVECLDHFRATGKLMADWKATARNWIRRDLKYRKERGGASPTPATATTAPSAISPEELETRRREAQRRALAENQAMRERHGAPAANPLDAMTARLGAKLQAPR